ncbi:MAG: anhydro-N-acetylmuramic acid kinase [Bacteroidales bacterium]|nr:anhydro-N-acetylmuramic acid kinase [Bacteroidales bacterium]
MPFKITTTNNMQSYQVIGVMSGTSLDGLDIVLCKFVFNNNWEFEILESETIEYNAYWKENLSKAQVLSGIDLLLLHKEYGRFIGQSINQFMDNTNETVDFVSSHGHTVFHQPAKKLTLQIGDGAEIAAVTGITTISDFRSLDVALGGQGAPLVPVGDELLFPEYDYCLNIGGFANISFSENNTRLAYDICPANIILNFLAQKLNHTFDKDGKLGQSGNVSQELLKKLNSINYYEHPYPKSLGKEWLDSTFIPVLAKSKVPLIDQLSTVYEHIAQQISGALPNESKYKTLITGGGAYNSYLVELITQKTKSEIIIPDKNIIEYKEALIFAFLGILRFKNQVNCLSSVTGARKDSSSGLIHLS